MELKMMSFNIHHGRGTDRQLNLERIGEVIARSGADIIGLNEVDNRLAARSDYMDQAVWLAEQLAMNVRFGASVSKQDRRSGLNRQYGNAILSRYPIVSDTNHHFNFYAGMMEGRSILETVIIVDNQPCQVYITHLTLNPFFHRKQTDYILHSLGGEQNPVIIMGDWNMIPGSSAWKAMNSRFRDVWHEAGSGSGFTYPSLRPKRRLDYIFINHLLTPLEADVASWLPQASDHLPVIAKVKPAAVE